MNREAIRIMTRQAVRFLVIAGLALGIFVGSIWLSAELPLWVSLVILVLLLTVGSLVAWYQDTVYELENGKDRISGPTK